MVSYSDPTIEVLSQPPRYDLIMGRMRHVGLRPIRASVTGRDTQPCPLFLDQVGAPAEVEALLNSPEFPALCAKRPVILVGGKLGMAFSPAVLHLNSIDQISSLPARLSIRDREARRVQEAHLRSETAERLGETERAMPRPSKVRVLFLGECSPKFISLKAALAERNVETVAAISHITATDYLESAGFEAMIVHPKHSEDEAALFLARLAAKTRLQRCHLCVVESPAAADFIPNLPTDSIDSLISDQQAPEDIAEIVLNSVLRARASRPTETSTPFTQSIRSDGLYSRRFFEAHLEAQIREADKLGDPLSLICLTAQDDSITLSDWSGDITRYLRDTDLAARLDSRSICLSLRSTPYRGAVSLARRIEEHLGTPISWRAVERRQFHTLKTLLSAVSISGSANVRKLA